MGQIKNIKLHIVTDIKESVTMLRLAQRSKLLGASARLLAASRTAERDLSLSTEDSKKAVVFNLAGGVVPSMNPVFEEYAHKYTIPPRPAEIKQKVLVDADDAQLLENVNIMLASRSGSVDENTRDLLDAIESIKAEGWKTILVDDKGEFNNIPFDTSVFDQTIPALSPAFVENYDAEVAKSDIIYVDNAAANLEAAAGLGISTVEASETSYLETLTALEGKLGIPLKACIPGVTFNWYDKSHNPYGTKMSGNKMYVFLVYMGTVCAIFGFGRLGLIGYAKGPPPKREGLF